ncbi:MAG: hypothetical protein J6S67_15210 [Methanobrevibacter sp.]|nr:hypothetical protein [Methanobrevibacter sp.]
MAFADYLIKVGTYTIPNSAIKFDSWSSIYETQDFDSYRDANGDLHRNALQNRKMKVEFNTPYMYKKDFDALMAGIRGQFLSSVEQSANVTAYIDEMADYVTQKCYLVNVNPKVAQNSPLGIIYQPTRICFIAY